MVIYVFYVHFRTHISEIWVWLSGYLRYLRPFSHTYIRKLSLVKWLSTLSTSIFGHTYLKLSSVAWFTLDILGKPINLHIYPKFEFVVGLVLSTKSTCVFSHIYPNLVWISYTKYAHPPPWLRIICTGLVQNIDNSTKFTRKKMKEG